MSCQDADKLYEQSEILVVGAYYYGGITRDVAFRDFKSIQEEKSQVPLLDSTVHESFERVLKKIKQQRLDIEGS